MALSEGFTTSNGGSSTGAGYPTANTIEEPEDEQEVSASTQPNEQTQPMRSRQNGGLKTNGTVRPSTPGSASSSSSSSHVTDSQRLAVLLPNVLPPPCCVYCSPRQPVCCNGNPQDCALFQSTVSSAALHMGSCCVQGVRCFCMQHHWPEHLQNQPNMATLRLREEPVEPLKMPSEDQSPPDPINHDQRRRASRTQS
ncbi:protein dispatched homolog 1-like [Garra rufa]|uniref:protein dispatched homolog 1-like n=1 Tax=Garra rufa TaxID=137080 RepID=UPI003CCEF3A3